MRLIEAEAKALLRRRGVRVPNGALLAPDAPVPAAPNGAAVKAQMLKGGRGKLGLVQVAEAGAVEAAASAVRSKMRALKLPPHILLEDKQTYAQEYYLAWRIDDVKQAPVMMFSTEGGVEIESSGAVRQFVWTALKPLHPHHLVGFLREAGVAGRAIGNVARLASELYRAFRAEDAELVEINPLAITANGEVIVLDAKINLDDNAAYRHREWRGLLSAQLEMAELTPLEQKATEAGFTFVELDGKVCLFAGGAGFGMALVDLLAGAGVPAANFADASGASGPKEFGHVADVVLARAMHPDVKAVVLFQTMSASSIKGAVTGMLEALDRNTEFNKPLIVGFAASEVAQREMTSKQANALFRARGCYVIDDLDELVPLLRTLCG